MGRMTELDKRNRPLRACVRLVSAGLCDRDSIAFTKDKVLLECGHTAYSDNTRRVRCWKCAVDAPPEYSLTQIYPMDRGMKSAAQRMRRGKGARCR